MVVKNKKGMAALEIIPILVITVFLMNFALGFWGIVHTGILNSIAARNYAFETFRHGSNLSIWAREEFTAASQIENFRSEGVRYHGITSELRPESNNTWWPSQRPLTLVGLYSTDKDGNDLSTITTVDASQVHNRDVAKIKDDGSRNQSVETRPVWIKPLYGICLNSTCTPFTAP